MSDEPRNKNDGTQDCEEPREEPQPESGGNTGDPPPAQAGTKRRKLLAAVLIAVAVVMVLAASAVLFYNRWFKKPALPPDPSQSDNVTESAAPTADPSAGPSPEADPAQPKVSGDRKSRDIFTILIFGSDVVSGLTDTIMVVTYDVTNQQATVMSIPRDTLVNVSAPYKNINGVYTQNGMGESGTAALKREVSELVGFTPDYCVMIDWELVGEMVDAIGGVWYDIPYHMDYDDPAQDLHIHYDAGRQFLNGEDAMNVVRWRENNVWSPYYGEGGGGDITRLDVQHGFLKAVLKQTLQIRNVTKITQLADLFGQRVVSELSVENIFWFGSQAVFGGLGADDVEFCTMPYVGVFQGIYANRVYPDRAGLLKLVNEKLNPFVKEVTLRELDLIRVSADGNTLSSSTGVLADPSAASPPVWESDPPEESGTPGEDDPPEESGQPGEDDPPEESGQPGEDDPPEESGQPGEDNPPMESVPPGEDDPPMESGQPGEDDPPMESDFSDIPPAAGLPGPSQEPAQAGAAGNLNESDP